MYSICIFVSMTPIIQLVFWISKSYLWHEKGSNVIEPISNCFSDIVLVFDLIEITLLQEVVLDSFVCFFT